jgi:hypothetical protein
MLRFAWQTVGAERVAATADIERGLEDFSSVISSRYIHETSRASFLVLYIMLQMLCMALLEYGFSWECCWEQYLINSMP